MSSSKSFSIILLTLFFCSLNKNVLASDWVEMYVLTNRIIVLKFDDGYIHHSGYRAPETTTETFNFPLDISMASAINTYKIHSLTDPNYQSAVHPLQIGRKTKGKDYSNNCIWQNNICDNEFVNEHYLYLILPEPLVSGQSYVVDIGQLADNYTVDTLQYNELQTRSGVVHANQIGFIPDAPVKYAYLSHWMGDAGSLSLDSHQNARFYLVDMATGDVAYEGTITQRLDIDNAPQLDLPRYPTQGFFSMSDVWQCDFSDFRQPGEYVIAVEGMGASFPFKIDEDIYREPYYHATRQLYHQRSGIPLEAKHTDWTRPRNLHADDKRIKFQYTTSRWFDWQPPNTENGVKAEVYAQVLEDFDLTTWGWYMDAGDWDGYYTHLRIPRLLMAAYELAPEKFADGELNIPESGNGIPDVLDEARFLIDYLDRTRGPSGGIAGARIHPDFEKKAVDNIPSWEDERVWTISGEDHITTYTFAGMAAHLAYFLGELGFEEQKDNYQQKALEAYEWANENYDPQIDPAYNARMYAAACLYKLTAETAYQEVYATDLQQPESGRHPNDNLDFAVWAYLTTTHATDQTTKERSLNIAKNRVDGELVVPGEARSFRVGFGWNFRTFLGQATTPLIFPALVLYHITGEEKYFRVALTSSDYMLGGNPLDYTWLLGFGDQYPQQVLHLDSWLHPSNRQEFIMGTIPYGPTAFGEGWPRNNGPWSSDFALVRIYPEYDQWPWHEAFFNNRYAVPTNEYTVHQTSAPAAAVYGLLSGTATGSFQPNQRPTVALHVPENLVAGTSALLEVSTTDEDGYIRKVEFYNGKQKIGQSTEAPFNFYWGNIPEGSLNLSAIATDNEGLKSSSHVRQTATVASIQLSAEQLTLEIDSTAQLFATVLPEEAAVRNVVWEVADENIAAVDQQGIVLALAPGTTQVTVRTLEGGFTAKATATVNAVVSNAIIPNDTMLIYPNPVRNGQLVLQLAAGEVARAYQLINLQGQPITQGRLSAHDLQPVIVLPNIAAGTYILKIEKQNGTETFRVIVE